MASYHHILQHTKPRFESPAKVFAKLKSKVQREEKCAKVAVFTGRDTLCNARDIHGADFRSPKKKTESTWMTEELKENQRFGSFCNEAQALILSPISSPQKTFGYFDTSSKPAVEMPPVTEIGHGCTPRKRAFLEPALMSPSLNRKHAGPPQIRDIAGLNVTSRTPVKIQPGEKDSVRRAVFEEELDPLMSPTIMYSPIRKRLRKRKCEPWGVNNVSSSKKEVSSEVLTEPQERKTSSAFSEDDNSTRMGHLGPVRGFSGARSEMNQFTELMLPPPRSTTAKLCCNVEKIPLMSPAKIFAYMKERESKSEQHEAHKVSSSTRDLFGRGNIHPSRDTPPSTAHNMGEMEDTTLTSVPDSVLPDNRSRGESADSQLDRDPSECVLSPAVPSQPVLLEDPLVLNTPRISIPKKNKAVFKRNKWPQCSKFPSESVIYLKKWFLRKNHKGLFVDGIHQEENIPWNSNIIVERVSNCVLKTVSGRVYILVGKINLDVDSGFPKWLLKKFVNGFPTNWKALYEKFHSESRNTSSRETGRNSGGRGIMATTKAEMSSISLSEKQHRQKLLKTSDSCPPASSSSTKMSRSGRIIKPPLEFWKGGRVTLDAQMNVTIHECYDTTIISPVNTTVTARASQTPAHVFLPNSKGRKQCESSSYKDASGPVRRIKAPVKKCNRAKVNPDQKASYSPDSSPETLSSPEEWSGKRTRSNQRCPPAERTLYVDTVPPKRSKPKKSSTHRSKNQIHDAARPAVSTQSKWAVLSSLDSPTVNDQTSQDQSTDDDFIIRRKSRGKGANRDRGEKSQPSHVFPSSASEESDKELKKRTKKTKKRDAAQTKTKNKKSKCTKRSPPTQPLSQPKKAKSKKHNEDKVKTQIPQEQDEWTETELMKLQEAVSYYPQHMAGYWAKVARIVGTRSAEECHKRHTSHENSQTPAKKAKEPKKMEAPKDPVTDHPVISARVGTLKRKQQVRQFLENMPREDVDDIFSSAYMQSKRSEIPSMCPSEDHDFVSDPVPLTPMSTGFPEVKTPQCLHITPGMMGSPSGRNDDKYVFQLQKRMKGRQFNVRKQAPALKSFSPTPSVKRTMRRCGNTENDTFVVWELFPENDGVLSDSGEEEDFYFSDDD